MVQIIIAWSYSRWKDHCKCPKLAYFKHVQKLKEPENQAMIGGNVMHKAAEDFVIGKTIVLAATLKKFEHEFNDLRAKKAMNEQEWAFDKDWKKVGWFDSSAWCRIKMDTHYLEYLLNSEEGEYETRVTVIDYKSGKEYPDHEEQRSLYALGAMLMYPDAAIITVHHWYMDTGAEATSVYVGGQVEALKRAWGQRVTPMLKDTRFNERVTNACNYCFFRKSNNGPCKF